MGFLSLTVGIIIFPSLFFTDENVIWVKAEQRFFILGKRFLKKKVYHCS